MKTIKVNRVLLDSVNITDEAIKNYPNDTLKKLKSILADISKNNIICDFIDSNRAQFQCGEGYFVIVHVRNTSRVFEFYHDEVVIE